MNKREFISDLFLRIQNHFKTDIEISMELTLVAESEEGATRYVFLNQEGLFAFKERWSDKLSAVIDALKRGGRGIEILAPLAPKNEGEPSDYYKVATIFIRSERLNGQVELLQEVKNNVIVKEFTLATFRFSTGERKEILCEIGSTWEAGIVLCGSTIKDFQRNAEKFYKERFVGS